MDRLTVAIFGKKIQIKNLIGNSILCQNVFDATTQNPAIGENDSIRIINTPNFFEEDVVNLDQKIIDFMALSYPGPHLFILAIDSNNTEEEKVKAQVRKLQEMFGHKITTHLVVMLPDLESFIALEYLSNLFTIWSPRTEQLANKCKRVCCGRQHFQLDYKNYSQDVVMRRIAAQDKRR